MEFGAAVSIGDDPSESMSLTTKCRYRALGVALAEPAERVL
jgi:hypothetical protein